jgi:hypothetical protein
MKKSDEYLLDQIPKRKIGHAAGQELAVPSLHAPGMSCLIKSKSDMK